MTNITAYDKERMLKNIKHWYQSHKQSAAHYQETGNEKAVEYHRNQMSQLRWMANVINKMDVVEDYNLDEEIPFQVQGFTVIP